MCSPSHPISVFICDICGRFPLQLEIYSPTDSTDFHRFLYPRIRVHPRYLWKTSPHPISVLICDICGRFPLLLEIYSPTDSTDFHRFCIFQYPCSSVLSVGNTFAPNICVHLCYLWEILSHPISVLICDICGNHPLLLGIYSPTDSTDIHRFYIFQYPCSSVLSVGDSFARRWKLLFLHRQRDAASALIHFRHSHHHVLV